MAATDFPAEIRSLRNTLESILAVSDLDGLSKQIDELSDQAAAPDLWDDPERAQASPASSPTSRPRSTA